MLEASDVNCRALNYISAIAGDRDTVMLRDQLCGAEYIVKPKVVVNAAGPWVDIVNDGLGQGGQRYIGGTKGSHLILDNPALLEAAQGSEIFFENEDGRIALILPFLSRVMIGTTDIRIDNPDEAVTSDEEIDYLLSMVGKVFPSIKVEPSQIVFSFSAVRPLPFSQGGNAGQISRDHSINTLAANAAHSYPIHSLIGGKWTTFRAFSEQAADRVLSDLGRPRLTSTKDLSIGGGRAYPLNDADRENWLRNRLQLRKLRLPAAASCRPIRALRHARGRHRQLHLSRKRLRPEAPSSIQPARNRIHAQIRKSGAPRRPATAPHPHRHVGQSHAAILLRRIGGYLRRNAWQLALRAQSRRNSAQPLSCCVSSIAWSFRHPAESA